MTATEPKNDLYAALLENIIDAAMNGRQEELRRYMELAENPEELAKLMEDEAEDSEEEPDESANYQLAESVLRDWEAARYAFDPAKHPRGQPDNAGQFGTAGGSAGDGEQDAEAPEPAAPVEADDAVDASGDPEEDYKANGTKARAFKAWFGDWEGDPENASKVVDGNGKPLVVYHGTRGDDFDEFKETGPSRERWGNRGHYFTANPEYAEQYSSFTGSDEGSRTIPVFLSIKNPKILPERQSSLISQAQMKLLVASGHDGVIGVDKSGKPVEFCAFNATQIKSAIGNAGTFNPDDPRIGYALEPYSGPRGGKGERDTVTGKITYTSHPSGERPMGRPRPRLVDPSKDDQSTYWLADWHCRHWNALLQLGWEVPAFELEAAEKELHGGDTAVWLDPETEQWETVALEVKEEGQTRYAKDASGHEHKGPGEGGGQFTSSGEAPPSVHATAAAAMLRSHPQPPRLPIAPPGIGNMDMRADNPELDAIAIKYEENSRQNYLAYVASVIHRIIATGPEKLVRMPASDAVRASRAKRAIENADNNQTDVDVLHSTDAKTVAATHPQGAEVLKIAQKEAASRLEASLANAREHIQELPVELRPKAEKLLARVTEKDPGDLRIGYALEQDGPSLSDTQVYIRALAASPASLTDDAKTLLAQRLQSHSPEDLEALKADVAALETVATPLAPPQPSPVAIEPPRTKKVRKIVRDEHGDIIQITESEEPV